MNTDECYYLGYIVKAHGLKGAFQVKLDVTDPQEYKELESVFVEIDKQLIPFFLENISIQQKGQAKVQFEDINSQEEARQLVGKQLFLPLDLLPELTGNHFYYHDIPGYLVKDKEFGEIGKIIEVMEAPSQDLLVIDCKGKEVLVPITDDSILKVDRTSKVIEVTTPDGLIAMYLED
ncbi:MAG: 16S rRNA processing protein RimM [Crocinitomicaceae bacterium]|nr:16S rRNA processing protein RimM [Crocinitomicaceae bacterium]|tara:strand:+ start:1450 stop:1980 length:531 start_codon:yes stop_codon:yes gene_type:complete